MEVLLLTYLLTCLVSLVTLTGGSGAEAFEADVHLVDPVTGHDYSHPPGSVCLDHLIASVVIDDHDLRLVLSHSHHYKYENIPVYVGEGEKWKSQDPHAETKHGHPCFYQDLEKDAGVSIIFVNNTYRMRGVFHMNKNTYTIKPEPSLGKYRHIVRRKSIYESYNQLDHTRARLKRQSRFKKSYMVELLAVVDFAIYKRWFALTSGGQVTERRDEAINMIKYYFTHILHEVDLRYKRIEDDDFSMSIVMSGLYIAETATSLRWEEDLTEAKPNSTTRAINGAKLLDGMETWLVQKTQYLHYDHVTFFTGYDMYDMSPPNNVKSYQKIGIAYLQGACNVRLRISAVEDKLDFTSSLTTAHELGHNLGATHDGFGNVCDSGDQYVMAAIVESATDENIYRFSHCSINAFKSFATYLTGDASNCLTNTATPYNQSAVTTYLATRPGTRFNITQQCRLLYGQGSFYCGGQDNVATICQKLVCYIPERTGCYILGSKPAFLGTTCGNKKWCDRGQCVSDPNAPAAKENCIYGDSQTTVKLGNEKLHCTDIVTRYRHLCYEQGLFDHCCESCDRAANKQYPDCAYGDKATRCHLLNLEECKREGDRCCETCRRFQTGIPGCPYGDSGSYSDCGDISRTDCYLPVGARCCETCYRRYQTDIQGCEFGDKISGCNKGLCAESYYERNCCQTCWKPTTPTTTVTTTTTTTRTTTSTARKYTTPTTRSINNRMESTTTGSQNNRIGDRPSGSGVFMSNLNILVIGLIACVFSDRIRNLVLEEQY